MPNGNRSLQFVTSGDPNFDARLLQVRDSLWDAVLQLVFNGSSTKQPKVLFDFGGYGFKFFFPVIQSDGGFVVLFVPSIVFITYSTS